MQCIMSCSIPNKPLLRLCFNIIDEIEPSTQVKTCPLLFHTRQNSSTTWECSSTSYCATQNLLEKTQLGSSSPSTVFTRHCPFRSLRIPIIRPIWGYQKFNRFTNSLTRLIKHWYCSCTLNVQFFMKIGGDFFLILMESPGNNGKAIINIPSI